MCRINCLCTSVSQQEKIPPGFCREDGALYIRRAKFLQTQDRIPSSYMRITNLNQREKRAQGRDEHLESRSVVYFQMDRHFLFAHLQDMEEYIILAVIFFIQPT